MNETIERRIIDRFWAKVQVGQPDECWEWQAATNADGYGRFGFEGANRLAHRVSWILHHDEIPADQKILHTCDNPPCVNPAHLFTGTSSDNQFDASKKGRHGHLKKTHCPKGHEYNEENTRRVKPLKPGSASRRVCRICENARILANYHRRRNSN